MFVEIATLRFAEATAFGTIPVTGMGQWVVWEDFGLWNDNFMRFYTKSVPGGHKFSRFRGTVV
ncbi:hypothetical protein BHYA_0078g00410 [Botrytis hyacinthi]|uniref:Uncharacterized protein n=1 Tax=Botrytis hyacinthi TaxID=278943 RepID=A0A4Z1GPL1_9HELO|nr:hypothetical protein BHYA_0078g00410 [Botrytis hyacinthi]